MDLRWGYDFSHTSHTPYQRPEFAGTIDCRISTLGIDIETPVEWTCEDLQEIMNQDSNPFEALLKNHPDRECKEETPAFQHILTDLLRAESDVETMLMNRRTTEDEAASRSVSTPAKPNTDGWHYAASQLHCTANNSKFCTAPETNVPQPQTFQQENPSPIQAPPTENATCQPPAEPNCFTYAVVTYNPEPAEPSSSSSSSMQKLKPKKMECLLASEVPVPFASFSPALPVEESKVIKLTFERQVSEADTPLNLECKSSVQTPKRKCQDSPQSTSQSPAQVVQQANSAVGSEASPILKSSPSPKPDSTSELGPFCKAAGISSSDMDHTALPVGRQKLPANALKVGIIVEMYGHWRQTRSPRRTFVRFLALFFDVKLDEGNSTMVDRLFRRVIAPLLVKRTALVKKSGAAITRQTGNHDRPKLLKGPNELAEFDSAVFAIPDFVTEPFQRRATKKPPKPTQGQQLIELQARFDAFRRVQRKHNLAFLRKLSRLQTKLDKLTHHLSKRFTSPRCNRSRSSISSSSSSESSNRTKALNTSNALTYICTIN